MKSISKPELEAASHLLLGATHDHESNMEKSQMETWREELCVRGKHPPAGPKKKLKSACVGGVCLHVWERGRGGGA